MLDPKPTPAAPEAASPRGGPVFTPPDLEDVLGAASRPTTDDERKTREVFALFQQEYAGRSVAYRWVSADGHGRTPELVGVADTPSKLSERLKAETRFPVSELRVWHVPAGPQVYGGVRPVPSR